MSITTYVGTDGVTINIKDKMDIVEILDLVQSMIMDKIDEDDPAAEILSKTMEEICALGDEYDWFTHGD